jgi:hypothetical protein
VYDSENAHDIFEKQLDRLLEAGVNVIVIEPSRLGDETARWLSVGRCLHYTSVCSGLGAVVAGKHVSITAGAHSDHSAD